MNFSWKSWSDFKCLSFITIHDSQLCNKSGMMVASYSVNADVEFPRPPIIGFSANLIISSHLLISFLLLLLFDVFNFLVGGWVAGWRWMTEKINFNLNSALRHGLGLMTERMANSLTMKQELSSTICNFDHQLLEYYHLKTRNLQYLNK